MTADERRALRIVRDALDLDAPERAGFLTQQCAGNTGLTARVEHLLAQAERYEHAAVADAGAATEREVSTDGDPLIGSRLGPFRVVERIGRGGMGVVYRGEREDADFQQTVALKLIRRGYDFDEVQARFVRERRILAGLSHPNLARFIDGGVSAEGRPWFALEFVNGQPIDRWCDERRMGVRERLRLWLAVCAAVQYAHTQLVVHRDLKPGNILIDDTGTVRLLDFGIARLLAGDGEAENAPTTIAGQAFTPEYAAPEQFTGETAGVAGDVYALGVVAYELIAGVLPYDVNRHDLTAVQHVVREMPAQALAQAIARPNRRHAVSSMSGTSRAPASDPRQPGSSGGDAFAGNDGHARTTSGEETRSPGIAPLDRRLAARSMTWRSYRSTVRGDLSRILDTALAKEPQRRYATVAAFAEDMQRWLTGKPVRASGNGLRYRLGKLIKRNAVAVTVAAALVVALLATSGWALHSAWTERLQRDAALREVARSNAVHDYVMLMFGDAAQRQDSDTLTARDVLRSGASQIATRFADQPETGQRVALALASLYGRLGDTKGALPLLEQVLAWPGIENNPDIQADARVQLAELEYYSSNIVRARELLEQARAWWSAQPSRHASLLNESLITLSQIERAEGDLDTALATLARAISERRALLDQPDRVLAMALNTQAVALIQAGRHREAMQAATDALAALRALDQEQSFAALAAIANRATAAMNLGLVDEAVRDFEQVVEQRARLHGPSPELAAVQSNLAQALFWQDRRAEAIALWESGLAMALAHGGETTRYVLPIRGHLAEAYVAVGRVEDAEALAEDAVRIAVEQYGATSPFTGAAKRARAAVRIAQRRMPEARADLDDATAIYTALGAGGERALQSLAPLRAQLPHD